MNDIENNQRLLEACKGLVSTLERAWGAKELTAPKFVQCQLGTEVDRAKKAIAAVEAIADDNDIVATTAILLSTPLGKAYTQAVAVALHMGISLEHAWKKHVKPEFVSRMRGDDQ